MKVKTYTFYPVSMGRFFGGCCKRNSASATSWFILLALCCGVGAGRAEVTWLTPLGTVNETWSGSGNINTSVSGVLRSVDGGGSAQRYGARGQGSPAPATGDRFILSNQVGDTLEIRRVRFIGNRARTLRHNTWKKKSGGWTGGNSVAVTMDFRLRAIELNGTAPGDVFTGSINVCVADQESDCDGATSDADFSEVFITIVIPPGDRVIVSNLASSLTMTHTPGSGAAGQDDFCLGSSGSSGVRITATSDNASGTEFRLRNGSDYVPYTVAVAGVSLGQGQLVSIPSSNSEISNLECLSDITSLLLSATETAVLAVPAGSYTDTLSLLAEPE